MRARRQYRSVHAQRAGGWHFHRQVSARFEKERRRAVRIEMPGLQRRRRADHAQRRDKAFLIRAFLVLGGPENSMIASKVDIALAIAVCIPVTSPEI